MKTFQDSTWGLGPKRRQSTNFHCNLFSRFGETVMNESVNLWYLAFIYCNYISWPSWLFLELKKLFVKLIFYLLVLGLYTWKTLAHSALAQPRSSYILPISTLSLTFVENLSYWAPWSRVPIPLHGDGTLTPKTNNLNPQKVYIGYYLILDGLIRRGEGGIPYHQGKRGPTLE